MIIIKVMGGLGNQMQQYAIYRKLLRDGVDTDVKLDISWFDGPMEPPREFEIPMFKNIPIVLCDDDERDHLLHESSVTGFVSKLFPNISHHFVESQMYQPEILKMKDKYIDGYFACQKYYDDIMDELCDLFAFPDHPDKDIDKLNKEIMSEMDNTHSVSVHIRRGSYIELAGEAKLFGNIATDEYYQKAMNYFRELYQDVHFYIFSNDSDYTREKFSDKSLYTIVDQNTGKYSMLDIQLMNHCMGNICANSTFSFWGARLNRRKDRVAVRTFMMRNNQPCDPDIMHEYWPGWILIDRNGSVV